jgi:hypothetical protein
MYDNFTAFTALYNTYAWGGLETFIGIYLPAGYCSVTYARLVRFGYTGSSLALLFCLFFFVLFFSFSRFGEIRPKDLFSIIRLFD